MRDSASRAARLGDKGHFDDMLRMVWMALGWLAVVLAIVALILPLVPSTPFLILATVSFARSSPRIHDWLVEHPRLGPPIRDWREHGAIGRNVKLCTVAGFALAISFSVAAGMAPMIVIGQLAFAAAALAFVLTRPSGPAFAD